MNVDEVKVGGYQVLTLLMLCVNLMIVGMSHALGIFYKYRPESHCQDDVINATSTVVADEANRTSVAHEWKLFCDNDQHLLNASGNVYFGGMLIGGIVAGLLMDRLGRTMIMAICLYAQGTMVVALNVVRHYSLFLTFRGIQGFFTQGLESSSYILCIELFPSKYRATIALIVLSARSVGLATLAGLDYAILDWRVLQLVVAVPTALTVAYIWLIPESARWLVSRERLTDAEIVIERIANYNALFSRKPVAPEKPKRRTIGDDCSDLDVEKSAEAENLLEETERKVDEGKTDLDAETEEEITSLEEKDQPNMLASKETLATEDVDKKDDEVKKSVGAIKRFFEARFIGRTCLVLMCLWFASSVAFHALISMSHRVKLERHASLAIAAVVELVTFLFAYLLISSRCGRRVPLCAGQTIAGAVCVAVAVVTMVVSEESDLIAQSKIAIVKVGAIANIVCFFVLRIVTIELFPTISRGTGLGLCVAAEMLAGLVTSPLITKMNDFVVNKKLDISRISIGIFCICVAFLTVILSETARLRSLPDSVEDAKNEKSDNEETDCEKSKNPEKLRKKLFSEDWVDAGNGIIVNFTENKTVD